MKKLYPVLLCLILTCLIKVHAQENDPAGALNSIRVNTISKDYEYLSASINKQSLKWLKRMRRQEARLRHALATKDSAKAAQLFAGTSISYQQLQDKLSTALDKKIKNPLKEYLPSLDSLSTATQFLQKIPGVSPDKLQQLNQLNDRLQVLQNKMQSADEIQAFIKEREQYLKEQLAQYGLGKQLLGINKTAYYYSQQVASYKELIYDRKKAEQRLIATVREIPAFKAFWQKSSILSRLFPMPAGYGTAAALTGLQSATQVAELVQQRMGISSNPINSSTQGSAIPQQYVEQAQAQLSQLKDKLVNSPLGAGGIMPDFKPNSLRTKRFLQRLEYGFNMQTSGATNFLPVTAELAALIGFKWNKNFSTGMGLSYKIGLGRGWNHIALSNQGAGVRSYIDARIKGNWWISGGMEYQYMKAFASLNEIKDINKWQRSTLIGLTRKYSIGKKKEGRLQVLYDFEAERQKPAGQPWKFRIGYSL